MKLVALGLGQLQNFIFFFVLTNYAGVFLLYSQAMLSFPDTGIQLAVSDTDTAPEGLFFELVKPPHHGIVLKYSTDVQEPMRAGEWSKSFPQYRRGVSLAAFGKQEVMDAPGR